MIRRKTKTEPTARHKLPDRNKFQDFAELLPELTFTTIFDVGANVGKTVTTFRRLYPQAAIWAFEPVKASYDRLVNSLSVDPKVHCFKLALGAHDEQGYITAEGTALTNRLVHGDFVAEEVEPIAVISGDHFCEAHSIERISYLKIDAEGHDLEVLRGFRGMLNEYLVDLLEVETGMTASNTMHVGLTRFNEYLEPRGYLPFRLYEQVGGARLTRANAVYLSTALWERQRSRDKASALRRHRDR